MAKLWEKGYDLDPIVEQFSVGRDPELDRALVAADAMASVAHARMLAAVGLLEAEEADALIVVLWAIAREGAAGVFRIRRSDEDVHTAIEARLIQDVGDAGKRIHTGRSRNDQVLVALRLYQREALLSITDYGLQLASLLIERAATERESLMPGRTHLQIAMPSTFGLWLAAWAEQLLDDLQLLDTCSALVDRSPLGSAASYGVPLPLDREYVAGELGFAAVHNNVLAVQLSRGALDAQLVGALTGVATTLGRMAQDLMLFALPELGYVKLPEAFCTGSSIMPQKRNPDLLELMRSRAAVIDGWATQLRGVVRGLPSGYNRDLQDSKEATLRGLSAVIEELQLATKLVGELEIDRDRMRAALSPEVFATDHAYNLVREGVPFREAYRRAAEQYADLPLPDLQQVVSQRTATGAPGNLNLSAATTRIEQLSATVDERRQRHNDAIERCLGGLIPLVDGALVAS